MIAGLFAQEIKDGPLIDIVVGLHGFSADLSYFLIAIHVYSLKTNGPWKEKDPSNNELISSFH